MDPHEMKMSYYVSVFGTLSGRSCCPEPPGVEDVADSPGGDWPILVGSSCKTSPLNQA